MACGDLPESGVQVFGEGFDDECWHGGKKVAFHFLDASCGCILIKAAETCLPPVRDAVGWSGLLFKLRGARG